MKIGKPDLEFGKKKKKISGLRRYMVILNLKLEI